jgi:hypothetical protein
MSEANQRRPSANQWSDKEYLEYLTTVQDARELLWHFVRCGYMLYGDGYYRDFQDALLTAAARLSAGRGESEPPANLAGEGE